MIACRVAVMVMMCLKRSRSNNSTATPAAPLQPATAVVRTSRIAARFKHPVRPSWAARRMIWARSCGSSVIAAVFCSDLRRSAETAEIAYSLHLRPIEPNRLLRWPGRAGSMLYRRPHGRRVRRLNGAGPWTLRAR